MAGIFSKKELISGAQAALSDRFILEIRGVDFALIDGVNRPGYKIETEQFQLLEYQFNFPKTIKFDNTVKFNIIELLDPGNFFSETEQKYLSDVQRSGGAVELTQMEVIMSRIFNDSYYVTPSAIKDPKFQTLGKTAGNQFNDFFEAGSTSTTFNLSKKKLMEAVSFKTGEYVSIHTLDAEGRKVDSIRLVNAMITSVAPSALKYSSADLNKIEVTLTFDYADYGKNGSYNYGNLADKARAAFPSLVNVVKPTV